MLISHFCVPINASSDLPDHYTKVTKVREKRQESWVQHVELINRTKLCEDVHSRNRSTRYDVMKRAVLHEQPSDSIFVGLLAMEGMLHVDMLESRMKFKATDGN